MVIENVVLSIKPGQEAEFEQAIAVTRPVFLQSPGCLALQLARGVENPATYLLQIDWDSVESHVAFTQTEGMNTFRTLAGPCFAERPSMEHFYPIKLA